MLWQLKYPLALWGIVPLLALAGLMLIKGKQNPGTFSARRMALYLTGLFLCILGLSRPQMGRQVATERGSGNNVFLAIDISQSMMAEDLLPNRLLFASTIIDQFLPEIAGARIALYPFAADGYIQVPLSHDFDLIKSMLPALGPSLTSDQSTDFDASLETLFVLIHKLEAKALERGESWQPTQVILLSDGETHEEISSGLLARYKSANIPIFTIGTATPTGAPVPAASGFSHSRNYMRDAGGQPVLSRLNRDSLRKIAEESGGEYFDGNLRSLRKMAVQLNRSTRLSKVKTELKVEREFYPWLFLFALVLLFIEFSFGRWEYAIRMLPFLLLSSAAFGNTEAELLKQIKETQDSEIKSILTFNLAVLYEKKQDHEKASEYYQEASYLAQDSKTKKKALFNLGNALLQSGRPKEAIEKYQEAHDLGTKDEEFDQPTNKLLAENMELAGRVLEQIKKNKKNQEGQGDSSQSDSKDPKGPQNDYDMKQFSEPRKRRIFDLIADKEQETLKRMRRKKNQGDGQLSRGKQW